MQEWATDTGALESHSCCQKLVQACISVCLCQQFASYRLYSSR